MSGELVWNRHQASVRTCWRLSQRSCDSHNLVDPRVSFFVATQGKEWPGVSGSGNLANTTLEIWSGHVSFFVDLLLNAFLGFDVVIELLAAMTFDFAAIVAATLLAALALAALFWDGLRGLALFGLGLATSWENGWPTWPRTLSACFRGTPVMLCLAATLAALIMGCGTRWERGGGRMLLWSLICPSSFWCASEHTPLPLCSTLVTSLELLGAGIGPHMLFGRMGCVASFQSRARAAGRFLRDIGGPG